MITKTKTSAKEKSEDNEVLDENSALTKPDQNGETPKKVSRMAKVLNASSNPPLVDDVVEGKVIGIEKACVYVDIPPFGTGIIYGREYLNARDIIKKINVGDVVAGKVISLSNKEGYIEISLKEAHQALIWSDAEEAIRDKKVFELPVTEANKGGLMLIWQGISGFLPASQLKTEHYPRVIPTATKTASWKNCANWSARKFRWPSSPPIAKRRQTDFLREKSGTAKRKTV